MLPLGLCNAPRTFLRLINSMLGDHINKSAPVYLEDILVYSKSADEHEAHLSGAFTQLCQHKLKAKCSKCEFTCSSVKYLGHVVGSGELRVDL